jgi:hypothetical protein
MAPFLPIHLPTLPTLPTTTYLNTLSTSGVEGSTDGRGGVSIKQNLALLLREQWRDSLAQKGLRLVEMLAVRYVCFDSPSVRGV